MQPLFDGEGSVNDMAARGSRPRSQNYTITFPIPLFSPAPGRLLIPSGLARDVRSHAKFEKHLRIIAPGARRARDVQDAVEVDIKELPGFSFRLLPWSGNPKTFLAQLLFLRLILASEARDALVWHTCCSTSRWDLTTESYWVGRKHATGLRVLGLDSDPAAMLEQSGRRDDAAVLRTRYRQWAGDVDLTIMVGQGVFEQYSAHARKSVLTNAVWLTSDDLADPAENAAKFADVAVVRMILPSRLGAWKGIDDTIVALRSLAQELPPWRLDIMGDGEDKGRLTDLASSTCEIRFVPPLPYGAAFFEALRSYHLVIAPTRAQEETRVVYDAAASGCVLLHSATSTLETALAPLSLRWSFRPGDPQDLARALGEAFAQRSLWAQAARASIEWMRGRTIDEMHAVRAAALAEARLGLRSGASTETGAVQT
jgi:glycosyltransferase involved in cell wall biosynthesis